VALVFGIREMLVRLGLSVSRWDLCSDFKDPHSRVKLAAVWRQSVYLDIREWYHCPYCSWYSSASFIPQLVHYFRRFQSGASCIWNQIKAFVSASNNSIKKLGKLMHSSLIVEVFGVHPHLYLKNWIWSIGCLILTLFNLSPSAELDYGSWFRLWKRFSGWLQRTNRCTIHSTNLIPHNWIVKKTLREIRFSTWVNKSLELHIICNAPSRIWASLCILKRLLEAVSDYGSHDVGIGWLLRVKNSAYIPRVGLAEEGAAFTRDCYAAVSGASLFWEEDSGVLAEKKKLALGTYSSGVLWRLRVSWKDRER